MRIAYISYEYPPDIGQGGIATYTLQVASMMQQLGHDVEIFCGSFERNETEIYKSVVTHRIKISDVHQFRHKVVDKFSERQKEHPFDIFESPEINGNGYEIKKAFPLLPLTVKLHTPVVLQLKILNSYRPFFQKLRFVAGALARGRIDLGFWSKHDKNQQNDIDYRITELADSVSAPSVDMKNWAVSFWRMDENKIKVIPYPYLSDQRLLDIPIETNNMVVTFHGKLNVHKGLVAFCDVVPIVLKRFPKVKFRLAGMDDRSHVNGLSMKEYIEFKLKKYINNIEFTGPISLDDIPQFLATSDICIFPSIWDNFPLVCLEAMSAGRAIVASNKGGMRDMLEPTKCGLLHDPFDVRGFAESIIHLLENPQIRYQFGKSARDRLLNEYHSERIGDLIVKFYNQTISGNSFHTEFL
jgi:glycosyltransferase involved in cell wall biosynthesis